jgi:hypothetical protein
MSIQTASSISASAIGIERTGSAADDRCINKELSDRLKECSST